MKGLIIDEPWIGLILQGKKTWEMRKTACHLPRSDCLDPQGQRANRRHGGCDKFVAIVGYGGGLRRS